MYSETPFHIVLADATAVAHAFFVIFVVGGQIMILIGWMRDWRWTRNYPFRMWHLAGIGFVAVEAWLGVACPLTVLENRFRIAAGNGPYAMSFLGSWVDRLLFYSAPEWVFTAAYSIFALLVSFTFMAYPPSRSHR